MIVYRLEHKNGDGIWFNRNGESRKPNPQTVYQKAIRGQLSGFKRIGDMNTYFSHSEREKYRRKGCGIAVYKVPENMVSTYIDPVKKKEHVIFPINHAQLLKVIT